MDAMPGVFRRKEIRVYSFGAPHNHAITQALQGLDVSPLSLPSPPDSGDQARNTGTSGHASPSSARAAEHVDHTAKSDLTDSSGVVAGTGGNLDVANPDLDMIGSQAD